MRTSATSILRAINCPHLDFYNAGGYWVFIYDDKKLNKFQTHSVAVYRLRQMEFSKWVDEGRTFARLMGYEAEDESASNAT